jgi:autotransporter family porin
VVALPPWGGVDPRANVELRPRVDGAFAGTTDEILQWAACKWGIDEDIARAMAVQESNWHQGARADLAHEPARCVAGDVPPCPTSFGLFQIKWTVFPGTYPAAAESTAFNADYTFAVLRSCYEGHERWLNDVERGRDYARGDLWGCLGRWYAGRWHTPAADAYIAHVQERLAARDWAMPDFPWR